MAAVACARIATTGGCSAAAAAAASAACCEAPASWAALAAAFAASTEAPDSADRRPAWRWYQCSAWLRARRSPSSYRGPRRASRQHLQTPSPSRLGSASDSKHRAAQRWSRRTLEHRTPVRHGCSARLRTPKSQSGSCAGHPQTPNPNRRGSCYLFPVGMPDLAQWHTARCRGQCRRRYVLCPQLGCQIGLLAGTALLVERLQIHCRWSLKRRRNHGFSALYSVLGILVISLNVC